VLNADYRPLSYYPLSLWPWQDAVKAAWLDRVDIVAEYEEVVHRRPEPARLQNNGRKFPPNYLHESWLDFLYWDAELEA